MLLIKNPSIQNALKSHMSVGFIWRTLSVFSKCLCWLSLCCGDAIQDTVGLRQMNSPIFSKINGQCRRKATLTKRLVFIWRRV